MNVSQYTKTSNSDNVWHLRLHKFTSIIGAIFFTGGLIFLAWGSYEEIYLGKHHGLKSPLAGLILLIFFIWPFVIMPWIIIFLGWTIKIKGEFATFISTSGIHTLHFNEIEYFGYTESGNNAGSAINTSLSFHLKNGKILKVNANNPIENYEEIWNQLEKYFKPIIT